MLSFCPLSVINLGRPQDRVCTVKVYSCRNPNRSALLAVPVHSPKYLPLWTLLPSHFYFYPNILSHNKFIPPSKIYIQKACKNNFCVFLVCQFDGYFGI